MRRNEKFLVEKELAMNILWQPHDTFCTDVLAKRLSTDVCDFFTDTDVGVCTLVGVID